MKKRLIQSQYNKKKKLLEKYNHQYFNLDRLKYQTQNMIN